MEVRPTLLKEIVLLISLSNYDNKLYLRGYGYGRKNQDTDFFSHKQA
jgi:hypothetical protein